jgi:hypothetical protein
MFYGINNEYYRTDVSSDGINFTCSADNRAYYTLRWTAYKKDVGRFLEFKKQGARFYEENVIILDSFRDSEVINQETYGLSGTTLSNTAADQCVGASDGGSYVYFMLTLSKTNLVHIEAAYYNSPYYNGSPQSIRVVSNIPASGCMSCVTFYDSIISNTIAFSISDYATLFVIRNGKVEEWPFKAGCKGLIARGKRLYCFVNGYYSEYDWDTKQIINLKQLNLGPTSEYPVVCGV